MSYCPACGHDNLDGAKFCEVCGAAQEAVTPTQQPAAGAPATTMSSAADSLTQAVSSAASQASKLGGGNNLVPIIAGVAVMIALFVGYNVFLAPMDAREYEKAVEDLSEELNDGFYDATSAVDEYYEDVDYDDGEEVDADDWKDVSTEYKEAMKEARVAMKELKGLRAPDKYKSDHEDLVAGIAAYTEAIDEMDQVIADAPGRDIGDVNEDLYEASEDMWNQEGDVGDFWDAVYEITE